MPSKNTSKVKKLSKKEKKQAIKEALEKDPFLQGRQAWNERYGSEISRSKNMTLIAFVASLAALAGVLGALYFAQRGEYIPYIVEIDTSQGVVQNVTPLSQSAEEDPRITRAMISNFVRNWRTVYVDTQAQRQAVESVYAFLDGNSPATVQITDWYRENVPFARAEEETVYVQTEPVLNITPNTYRVNWTESVVSRQDGSRKEDNYEAILAIRQGPVNPDRFNVNPTGIFIDTFDWSLLSSRQSEAPSSNQ